MLLTVLLGWLEREQRDVIAFLREEMIGGGRAMFCHAMLPPGQLRSEMRMGVLLSLVGAPLALGAARLLRVGRFSREGAR
jgi:hypothetical protein